VIVCLRRIRIRCLPSRGHFSFLLMQQSPHAKGGDHAQGAHEGTLLLLILDPVPDTGTNGTTTLTNGKLDALFHATGLINSTVISM